MQQLLLINIQLEIHQTSNKSQSQIPDGDECRDDLFVFQEERESSDYCLHDIKQQTEAIGN